MAIKGPGGKTFTDFAKVGFTITTKAGTTVSVRGDRCGGNTSLADVSVNGSDVFQVGRGIFTHLSISMNF